MFLNSVIWMIVTSIGIMCFVYSLAGIARAIYRKSLKNKTHSCLYCGGLKLSANDSKKFLEVLNKVPDRVYKFENSNPPGPKEKPDPPPPPPPLSKYSDLQPPKPWPKPPKDFP